MSDKFVVVVKGYRLIVVSKKTAITASWKQDAKHKSEPNILLTPPFSVENVF